MDAGTPEWDVFLSYSRSDSRRVDPIHEALTGGGLRVFRDAGGIAPGESIAGRIRSALARSRLLLAWYSPDYSMRRVCQEELRIAFLVGQREGDPTRRVLVVNPERSKAHIQPIHLRDTLHLPAHDVESLVAGVTGRLAAVQRTLGEAPAPRPLPATLPHGTPDATRRIDVQWALHSALHPGAGAVATPPGRRVAVVYGARGSGRTSLVADYARCFAECFPGGVFWLSAARWDEDVGDARRRLGTAPPDRARGVVPPDVASALDGRAEPALWIVDDIPAGMPSSQVAGLIVSGPTVLITGDARHAVLGEPVAVEGLKRVDGAELLRRAAASVPRADRLLPSLVDGAGGNPAMLVRVAELMRQTSPAGALAALHDPGSLLWRERATALSSDLAAAGRAGADLLRALAVVYPEPLAVDAVRGLVTTLDGSEADRVEAALDELCARSLVVPSGPRGELRIDAAARHVAPAVVDDAVRAMRVRALALRALRAAGAGDSPAGVDDAPFAARQAAHRVHMQIVHRVPARRLAPDQGSAREALSSMHELFRVARDTVASVDPDAAGASARGHPCLADLIDRLLEEILSPFLSTWHPRLSAWELARPADVSPFEHERAWTRHSELREEIGALHDPMWEIADGLRTIAIGVG